MKKAFQVFFKSTNFSVSLVIQISLLVVAIALIGGISYIIGFPYLSGNELAGNDTTAFFTITEWIHRYYPNIPFWYPLQGGGVSFDGYPWFAALIVNLITFYTKLDLAQSFRLLGFLSVPLTGIGIFVFCWVRLTKVNPVWLRQLLGIIAALFFAISPVSWIWLAQWGFYADQVSVIFVPWIFLFFDLYLDRLFNKKYDFLYRIGFVGTLVFWTLGFLTHFFVGTTSIAIFILMGITRFIFQKENKLLLARRLIVPFILFFVCLGGLVAFRYYSYNRYSEMVAKGGYSGLGNPIINREGTKESMQTPETMLSLKNPIELIDYKEIRHVIKHMRFPFYVWLLTLSSLLFAIFKSKKIFVFSLFSAIGFFANTNVDLYILFQNIPLLKDIPILNQLPLSFVGRYFFVPGRVLTPIAAAYGAYIIWELLFSLPLVLLKRYKNSILSFFLHTQKTILVTALTLVSFAFIVYRFYNTPFDRFTVNSGPYMLDLRDIWRYSRIPMEMLPLQYTQKETQFLASNPEYNEIADYVYLQYLCTHEDNNIPIQGSYPNNHLCSHYLTSPDNKFAPFNQIMVAREECIKKDRQEYKGDYRYCNAMFFSLSDQLALKSWKPFAISKDISGELEGRKDFFAGLPQDRSYRYDVTGFAGKVLQGTSLVNRGKQIQIYMGTLSLIYNSWNYLGQIMYTNFPLYQKPGVLTELGKWFGLEYVFLAGTPLEPLDYWAQDTNWEKLPNIPRNNLLKEKALENLNEGWRKFNQPTGDITWDNRPKMLVVTDNSKPFYDETFKFMTRGGLPYEQAVPVMGKKNVDEYSLSELKQYESILMRSYGYKSRSKAYRLLDSYIKSGGNLIFDTGWQYNIPDYQLDRAPSFMPFDSLSWQNLNSSARLTIADKSFLKDIDEAKLGDMRYGDNASWGVSTPGSLKDWAIPIVTLEGKPLIVAGKYGEGKVVWIGFNIIAHAEDKDAPEEAKLFSQLVSYIFEGGQKVTTYTTRENRISPDEVEFTLNQKVVNTSNLFFREAYYPDWKATLISGNKSTVIPVRRAGPGFMVLLIPPVQVGDRVALKLESPLGQHIANAVSIATFVGLLFYLVIPQLFNFISVYLKKAVGVYLSVTPQLSINKYLKKKFKDITLSGEDEDANY